MVHVQEMYVSFFREKQENLQENVSDHSAGGVYTVVCHVKATNNCLDHRELGKCNRKWLPLQFRRQIFFLLGNVSFVFYLTTVPGIQQLVFCEQRRKVFFQLILPGEYECTTDPTETTSVNVTYAATTWRAKRSHVKRSILSCGCCFTPKILWSTKFLLQQDIQVFARLSAGDVLSLVSVASSLHGIGLHSATFGITALQETDSADRQAFTDVSARCSSNVKSCVFL